MFGNFRRVEPGIRPGTIKPEPLAGLTFQSSDRVGYFIQQLSDGKAARVANGQDLAGFKVLLTISELATNQTRHFAIPTEEMAGRIRSELARQLGDKAKAHYKIL